MMLTLAGATFWIVTLANRNVVFGQDCRALNGATLWPTSVDGYFQKRDDILTTSRAKGCLGPIAYPKETPHGHLHLRQSSLKARA